MVLILKLECQALANILHTLTLSIKTTGGKKAVRRSHYFPLRPDWPRKHRCHPRYILGIQHNRRAQLDPQHYYQLRCVLQSALDRSNPTRHTSNAGAQGTYPCARKRRWQFYRSQHNWRVHPAVAPIQRCQRQRRPENRCILRSQRRHRRNYSRLARYSYAQVQPTATVPTTSA